MVQVPVCRQISENLNLELFCSVVQWCVSPLVIYQIGALVLSFLSGNQAANLNKKIFSISIPQLSHHYQRYQNETTRLKHDDGQQQVGVHTVWYHIQAKNTGLQIVSWDNWALISFVITYPYFFTTVNVKNQLVLPLHCKPVTPCQLNTATVCFALFPASLQFT